jgi:hypothetical protein
MTSSSETPVPRAQELYSRLASLSAILTAPTSSEKKALLRLEKLLVRSRITDPAAEVVPRGLSVESASWFSPDILSPDQKQHLEKLVAGVDLTRPEEYRVFRREAPLAAPSLDVTVPAWGRGAAIEQSLGPFTSLDGRQFWFDFYPLVRLVPIYLAGDPQPALLLYVPQLKLKVGDPLPIQKALHLLSRRYNLAGSSFWMRANLLDPGAPAGSYIGLRISGGHIRFNPPPIESNGKLTIPAGGQSTVQLHLAAPAAPADPPNQAGADATQAKLTLPKTLSFSLAAGHITITQLGDAGWRLYDQDIDFSWKQGPAPVYEPLLQALVIPMTAAPPQMNVLASQSPFAKPAGQAAIQRAGWILPVAAIDVTNPTEAAGIGGLAIQGSQGLTLGWRGLRDGPIRLPNPWVALWPGLVLIADLHASNLNAHQHFRLWKDSDSKFRSELNLRYTDSFPVIYAAAATGSEILLAAVDAEARLDRPVDVTGTPLPVHSLGSLLLLTYTDTRQDVFFYEDNILTDSLDPRATWPVEPGEAISLAIRNALFTITPVNSLFLFAELRNEEMVERGILLLGMGLYGLLPTLPDPYAANVSWLRRKTRTDQYARQVSLLLVAANAWTKAASDDDPDLVATSFAFAPLGPFQKTIETWSSAASKVQSEVFPAAAGFAMATAGQSQDPATAATLAYRSNQAEWDRFFESFEREQFALLDVSTNADQMGVSFAWFNPLTLDDSSYIYYQVYKPKGAQPPASPYPLQVRELDLAAESRYVRAFTVPQLSWEPLFNLTFPAIGGDPPFGVNLYPNDGGPTRLFNNSVELVPIAPIPVTEFLVKDFEERAEGFTGALFTLPFGLRAFAEFSRQNQFVPTLDPAKLTFNRPEYEGGALRGAMQLRADAPKHPAESPIFKGSTLQLNNVLNLNGLPSFAGTLGSSVGIIFNKEFFYDGNTGYKDRGVPLTRIDFCGYGASMFSHWQNPNAAIAATSQAHFDVFVGRTGLEVIQVRSLVYPWGIRVVRTITIFRVSSAYVFRFDTGWQAESDGIYDFRYNVYSPAYAVIGQPNPYEFHPGIVRGVFRVRNIRETNDVPNFQATWNKLNGEPYVDDNGILRSVDASTPANERSPAVNLQPLFFDADVQIDDVIAGAASGRVPSRGMLGYVQLAPRGEPIPPSLFAQLLNEQFGSLGGPVDCVINIGKSGQQMRLSKVDVNASENAAGDHIFVSAARGSVVLPKDGSWSVVQHLQGTGEVSPLDAQATVPLIRRGRLNSVTQTTDAALGDLLRLANPIDLVRPPGDNTRHYGLLQSTGTQKALFRLPSFQTGLDQLLGAAPDFADAYRILNSAGIFPNVQDALPLNLGNFKTKIISEGYQLLDQADPNKIFEQLLPPGPLYLINEEFLKLYVEYAKKDKEGNTTSDGKLRFGFDAAAADIGKKWLSKVNDIGMVVDLGPLTRLMIIKGKFDAQKGADPAFIEPELEFSDALQPVIDILQILLMLQGGDYKAAFQKGLEIAMSNTGDSWNYAFHARKEIPLVKFPPGSLYDNPTNPLKLEAHLAIGVYFNEVLAIPSSPGQLIPSCGAFLEFGGRLSVMCVSLAAVTVYATGSVDLRTAADIKTGPSLHMKFGFGAEIVVGLPVVGGVSLLYMVGVEIDLATDQITVAGFLLFRGRAEILGGIITVTIMIEAKGSVKRLTSPDRTDLQAQVTFGLDISIFLVINISFSESWQESRQIA